MQGLEFLIVPLIALGVWILSTVFKGDENEAARQRRRPGMDLPGRPDQRRPVTDLDRFLEEARRRRETGEKREPPPQRVQPPPRVTRPASPALPPRGAPQRPVRPAAPPRRQVPEPAVARPIVRTTTVTPPRPVPQPEVAVVLADVVVEAAAVAALAPAPAAPRPQARRPASPVLAQVAAMLRTPQAAGAALVLREIFDKPLCRRPRV